MFRSCEFVARRTNGDDLPGLAGCGGQSAGAPWRKGTRCGVSLPRATHRSWGDKDRLDAYRVRRAGCSEFGETAQISTLPNENQIFRNASRVPALCAGLLVEDGVNHGGISFAR